MTRNPSSDPRITAGWGTYDGPPPVATYNSSRITTHLSCPERAYRQYIADDVPVERPQAALILGSAWHTATELVGRGTEVAKVATMIGERLHLDAFNAEADGYSSVATECRKFAEFNEHALPVYVARYAQDDPTGTVVAVEQDFWVRIDGLLVLGRMDKVGLWHGQLVNGERKTIAEKEDISDFLALRRHDIQHNLYELALLHADHTTLGLHPDTPVSGTVYDLVRKMPYPLVASKNGTVEERRAAWEAGLFHTQFMPLSPTHQRAAIDALLYTHSTWGSRVRNLRACRAFTNRMCPHFDACINGVEGPTQPRTRDYVDEVPA